MSGATNVRGGGDGGGGVSVWVQSIINLFFSSRVTFTYFHQQFVPISFNS